MESILIKHINMPQTSRHIRVPYSDISAIGTYTFDIVMPESAIVEKVNVVTTTAFAGGTVTIDAGDNPTGGAVDKYMSATAVTAAGRFESDATAGEQMQSVVAFTDTDDQEPNYVVRLTVATAGGALSAGEFVAWVDFRYNPNEVYS